MFGNTLVQDASFQFRTRKYLCSDILGSLNLWWSKSNT